MARSSRADRFFDVGFAHPDDPITATSNRFLLPNDLLKDWQDRLDKHWLQLTRRSREEKQMRRCQRGIQARRKIESGSAFHFR